VVNCATSTGKWEVPESGVSTAHLKKGTSRQVQQNRSLRKKEEKAYREIGKEMKKERKRKQQRKGKK
jgi:hypothetical protein